MSASLALLGTTPAFPALADEPDELIDCYFGMGCFWHIQHEFVEGEIKLLKRKEGDLTARAGYAGGSKAGSGGCVCYHNLAMKDEYGKLGHCEVVNLKIPKSSFSSFCDIYFSLFDQNGDRPDQRGDRGLEYRSVVGIPGGEKSDLYPLLLAAAEKSPVNVLVGKGNDPDAPRNTYVMDNNKYPFYLGELYHQFHDGFARGEDYPASYNNIKNNLEAAGKLEDTTCPFV
ncbi:hypothetical protein TrRE_jg4257 [Triparma retinervis]|uniref:peptide-methionine (S)-S-oxide reductase n=1 Tax=Triparma retinervis TaxID=2557542 RepID=A0A9W7A7S1_9STRA|nr:hypothetical protein TrRE_jg4257 [Triparma retinervis]